MKALKLIFAALHIQHDESYNLVQLRGGGHGEPITVHPSRVGELVAISSQVGYHC